MTEDSFIIVYCSCNSDKTAAAIAENLVNNKLAACINMVKGVESVYQWQGKIEHDNEILLIIKTRQSLYAQLEQTINELHDYELPEVIAVPIVKGSPAYINWIKSATE